MTMGKTATMSEEVRAGRPAAGLLGNPAFMLLWAAYGISAMGDHISEMALRRIQHPRDVVREGEVVTVRITDIDRDRRRISLSLKECARLDQEED